MTPLMSWPTDGKFNPILTLSGETFGHGPTQWFGTYLITADGEEALRITISDEPKSSTGSFDETKLHTLKLWVDGKEVTAADKTVRSKRARGLSVKASPMPVRKIGRGVPAETVEIEAPSLAFAIQSAGANKYDQDDARRRWAHLNMKMKSQLPQGVTGLIAELAGLQHLSKETKSFLTVPKVVAEARALKRLHRRGTAQP